MAKKTTIKLYSTGLLENGTPKQPSSNDLVYGELALNYASDNETIFIKNTNNQIVKLPLNNLKGVTADLSCIKNITKTWDDINGISLEGENGKRGLEIFPDYVSIYCCNLQLIGFDKHGLNLSYTLPDSTPTYNGISISNTDYIWNSSGKRGLNIHYPPTESGDDSRVFMHLGYDNNLDEDSSATFFYRNKNKLMSLNKTTENLYLYFSDESQALYVDSTSKNIKVNSYIELECNNPRISTYNQDYLSINRWKTDFDRRIIMSDDGVVIDGTIISRQGGLQVDQTANITGKLTLNSSMYGNGVNGGLVLSFGKDIGESYRIDVTDSKGAWAGNSFTVLNNGYLGIGINKPERKLHVNGSAIVSSEFETPSIVNLNNILFKSYDNNGVQKRNQIYNSERYGFDINCGLIVNGNVKLNIGDLWSSQDSYKIGHYPANFSSSIDFNANGSIGISASKIGLGINTPVERLDVNGNGVIRGNLDVRGTIIKVDGYEVYHRGNFDFGLKDTGWIKLNCTGTFSNCDISIRQIGSQVQIQGILSCGTDIINTPTTACVLPDVIDIPYGRYKAAGGVTYIGPDKQSYKQSAQWEVVDRKLNFFNIKTMYNHFCSLSYWTA